MKPIEWSQKFSVGIRLMDEQHLNIIGIINNLIDARNSGIISDEITKAIHRMLDYAKIHFKDEEKLMAEYQYPGLASQKKSHDAFLEKTLQYSQKARAEKDMDCLELIDYLQDWWVKHILVEDMEYKDFFKTRGAA